MMLSNVIKRKNLNINKMENKFYYLLFAIISVTITYLNIGGPYIIHFIDIMWPLNPVQSIYNSFNIWSYSNYGYFNGINIFNFSYYLFIAMISYFPVYLQELILLSLLQCIGAVYVFKLFKEQQRKIQRTVRPDQDTEIYQYNDKYWNGIHRNISYSFIQPFEGTRFLSTYSKRS